MGFYCFTSAPATTELTMKQKVAALTNVQKQGIIDGFAKDTSVGVIQHKFTVAPEIISYLYEKIDEIQKFCRSHMRGEIIVTPAVLDEQGQIITPAVMNTPSVDQATLEVLIDTTFKNDLGSWIITQIMLAIYKNTKYDGNGTYAFYAQEIVK